MTDGIGIKLRTSNFGFEIVFCFLFNSVRLGLFGTGICLKAENR